MAQVICYRFQEILAVLKANPEGLSTAQVHAECKKVAGSELPINTPVLSGIIYTMRNKKLLRTSQTKAGNVHFITPSGVRELKATIEADQPVIDKEALKAMVADSPVPAAMEELNTESVAMEGPTTCRPEQLDNTAPLTDESAVVMPTESVEIGAGELTVGEMLANIKIDLDVLAVRLGAHKPAPEPIAIENINSKIACLQEAVWVLAERYHPGLIALIDDLKRINKPV